MRYYIGNRSGKARLSDEWEALSSYVDIQRIRFQDRIFFSMETADEVGLETFEVPPLILQPIVENAIHHGMERQSENGRITIEAMPCETGACVVIRDNGKGISEEIMRCLERGEYGGISSEGSGIGMQNVIRRMECFFGRSDLIKIDSAPGRGTAVTLMIPEESEKADEGSNC